MQPRMPDQRLSAHPTLGRGWVLPAVVLGAILAGAYLPAHGVRGLADTMAATIAALGLIAVSLAASSSARAAVLGHRAGGALLGAAPVQQAGREVSPQRRIAAVAVGATVTAALVAVIAAVVTEAMLPAGHAVLLVVWYANIALLLSNVVPMPPWPGWTLLIALLDGRGTSDESAVDRAVPIARGVIMAEAAAIAALAVGAGDGMLLLVAALLVWQGRTQITVAQADDLITRYLTTRRVGSVARELSAAVGPEEPARIAAARGAAKGAVVAVRDGSALLGAIGPRQVAMTPRHQRVRCADVMVLVGEMELLRPEAPASSALAQLDRFGFGLVLDGGRLHYVEANDLLSRMLLTASVAHAVRTSETTGGGSATYGPNPSKGSADDHP